VQSNTLTIVLQGDQSRNQVENSKIREDHPEEELKYGEEDHVPLKYSYSEIADRLPQDPSKVNDNIPDLHERAAGMTMIDEPRQDEVLEQIQARQENLP
jgi:hypothetical protein